MQYEKQSHHVGNGTCSSLLQVAPEHHTSFRAALCADMSAYTPGVLALA